MEKQSILNEIRLLNIAMHRSMASTGGKVLRKPTVAAMVAHFVFLRGGCVRQKEVEKEFHLRRSSVSQMLRKMEADGYIVRETASDGDGRSKQIILSEKGRAEQEETTRQIEEFDGKFDSALDAREKETFFALVHKIRTNLERK